MALTHEEKIKLMGSLNWDYNVSAEDMLAVIEGRLEKAAPFTRDFLFLRSLERLPWHYITGLWGIENIKALYTEDLARRIWPRSRRREYDFALAVLRGDPVPLTRWGVKRYESKRNRFFSNRGNSS